MARSSPGRGGGPSRSDGGGGPVTSEAPRSEPPPPPACAGGPSPRPGEELVRNALIATAERFAFSSTPRLDAELLMAHALRVTREALLLGHMHDPIPPAFAALVQRRAAAEPVAYITGRRAFWTIELAVDPRVLIPRADSETLIEAAVDHFAGTAGPSSVLDLGTGSGALLLAALDQWPAATGVGLDRSTDAVEVARDNARRLGLADRARIEQGDWHGGLQGLADAGGFDLVLCNPPYIATAADLPREVAGYEPAAALYAGPEGHDDLLRIAAVLPSLLDPGSIACIEMGHDQGAWAIALFRAGGFGANLRRDLGGNHRCVMVTP